MNRLVIGAEQHGDCEEVPLWGDFNENISVNGMMIGAGKHGEL